MKNVEKVVFSAIVYTNIKFLIYSGNIYYSRTIKINTAFIDKFDFFIKVIF